MSVEPAAGAEDGSLPLITSEIDEALMRKNLLECYGTETLAFRVSVEHYRYLVEQVVSLRQHVLRSRPALATDARALAESRAEVAALTAQVEALKAAMKWVSQVRPSTLQDGGARVEMTWEEFNAMRIATGLLPQIPSRRTKAALSHHSAGEVKS